jgi:hypothetical protein
MPGMFFPKRDRSSRMKGTGSSGCAVLPAPPRGSIGPRAVGAGGNFYPQLLVLETQTEFWMTLASRGLEVQ